jgi:hypothetical protein
MTMLICPPWLDTESVVCAPVSSWKKLWMYLALMWHMCTAVCHVLLSWIYAQVYTTMQI